MQITKRAERALLLARTRRAEMLAKAPKSFLSVADLSREQFDAIIDGGLEHKRNPGTRLGALQGRAVALLFQKTSTRTRCSFEVGVAELGGQPMYIDWRTSNFMLASLKDEIRVLSRYADLIVARVNEHADLLTMRSHSEVPIINGLSDESHPCQALADYMTIKEYFGTLDGLTIAYVGDGNNVARSLIEGARIANMTIKLACPPGYEPRTDVVDRGRGLAHLELCGSPEAAVSGADVIYTDTWVSMGQESSRDERLKAFSGYRVDERLISRAPTALVMHCLPAHRGEEVSDSAIDSERSVIFDQAENRKHVQKALMCWLLSVSP